MKGITREQLTEAGARFITLDELLAAGIDPEILKIDLFFTGEPDGKLDQAFGFDKKTQACSFRTETGAAAGTATEFVIYPKGAFNKPTENSQA